MSSSSARAFRVYLTNCFCLFDSNRYLAECLKPYIADALLPIIIHYLIWILEVGLLVDVLGSTGTLNMFFPAATRWDVCIVEDVKNDSILARPLDRCHPYPYLYPTYQKPNEWVSLSSNRIEPYLSRVRRPEPKEATEYDMIDARDPTTGQWMAAEVCANVGSTLWLLFVDNYKSAEYKDSCRLWVDITHPHLAPYRSQHTELHPKLGLLALGKSIPVIVSELVEPIYLVIYDRYSNMLVLDTPKQSTNPLFRRPEHSYLRHITQL